MSAPLRAKKKNNTIVWAILGLLVVSLTGFGVQSVGHGGSQAIGSVGDEKVTVDAYARALNGRIRALSQQTGQNITLEQALAFGIDRQVLSDVLATAALDSENSRIGLSIGDKRVRASLLATEAFQSLTGEFDVGAYEFALDRANLNAGEYDEVVRREASRSMLRTTVSGGVQATETYALAMLNFLGETRDFVWAPITADMLDGENRAPNPVELRDFYAANPESYTSPELRKLTYVVLTPEMLTPFIEIDEAALRTSYESQSERFNQPARRIVDRLVFSSDTEAQSALEQVISGTKIFEDIVAARDLAPEDVDLGEITQSDLDSEAAKLVFAQTEPGLVGPVKTLLGPALFRINAVLEAQSTSFEDARAELHAEFTADMARRRVDDEINAIDDLLAGGATLEDVAAETEMTLHKLDFAPGVETEITAYAAFREAAQALQTGDFPEVLTLSDGGIFAVRLDSIAPPELIAFDDVAEKVSQDWQAAETFNRIQAHAADLAKQSRSAQPEAELGITNKVETGLRRENFVENAPADLLREVFTMNVDEVAVISDASGVVLVTLNAIHAFDKDDASNQTLVDNVTLQFSQEVASDVFAAFVEAVEEEAGITVNRALINAVHTQLN